jgi:hypothetical protein
MAVIGGPVENVSIAGRTFGVPQDSEVMIVLGGDQNTVEPNGDGATARIIKEKVPFKISSLSVVIDDDRDDHQFIQDVVDGTDFVDIALSMPKSGDVFYGQGIIIDEIPRSVKKATMELTISGQGRLDKQ